MFKRLPWLAAPVARRAMLVAGVALLFFLCAIASRLLVIQPLRVAVVWPPSGLLLAALLLSERRAWPGLLGAVFAANLLANALTGMAPAASAGLALANCAEAALVAAIVARQVGAPLAVRRLRQAGGFVLWGAVLGNALAALLGAAVSSLAFGTPFANAWLASWISDGLGMLLVGAALLAWFGDPRPAGQLSLAWLAELALLFASSLAVALFTFATAPSLFRYTYQIFPFVIWAAVRFGPRQSTLIALLLAAVVLGATAQGSGPFATAGEPPLWQIQSAQIFLWVVSISALVLSAIVQEHQQAKGDLQHAQNSLQYALTGLEQRVAARTAELTAANMRLQQEIGERERAETFLSTVLRQLPIGVTIVDAPSGQTLRRNAEADRILGQISTARSLQLFHPGGQPYQPDNTPIARVLREHIVVRQENMIVRRGDGSEVVLAVNAAPIYDAAGQVLAAVGTFHDISHLREMENTLSRSQAQLASVIDSAMDAIITIDERQRITMWNTAAEQMFLSPAAQALGQPIDRFIPARYAEAHREHIYAFGRTGTSNRTMGEQRALAALRANGEEFPIEASISQVTIEGHKLYTVILRDITARVRAEQALRKSEERFSKAFHLNPIAMVISSLADGRIIDVNDGFLRLFGLPRDEVIGQTSLLLDMWQQPADRALAIAAIQRDGALRDMEVRIRASGENRDVLLSADLLQLAGEACILTTLYDISERKHAEQALHESRQQLQAILDNAPALISLKRPNGDYMLVNRRFGTLFERAPETIIGRSDAELFPPALAATLQANDQAVLQRGRPIELEEIVPLHDGPHTYSSIKFPLVDLRGEAYALCSIATDITERKLLEAQLVQAQKMDSIGQLAGGIAHDFNNLLTAISGYTELVLAGLATTDPSRDDLEEVLKAANRATTLTRQLLAFARRQPIAPHVINLNTLVTDIDKLLRRLISEDIALDIRLTPGLHPVKVDPGQIEQVVLNLVVNARDAMPEGGYLLIETGNVILDPRYAHGHLDIPAGRYVMLAVTDSGMGMAPEVQAHVFEPFFTTKDPGKGTGLGLSTCYGIVKQHGGTIWIYSEIGQGTTVKVYLPESDAVLSTSAPKLDAQMPGGGETILLVEDEDAVRALAARSLRACGYTVIEAINGAEALRIARAYAPATIHMLLSDVVMPQMGGKAVAEQVTALYPNIRVLFISGYTEHATLHNSRIDAGSAFLQKPFTPALLARKVRDVLDNL